MNIKYVAFAVRTEVEMIDDNPVTVWIEIEQDGDSIVVPSHQLDSLIGALIKARDHAQVVRL